MSVNTYISIEDGMDGIYTFVRDADTGLDLDLKKNKTLIEALKTAMTLMKKGDIEYGISHIDKNLLKERK